MSLKAKIEAVLYASEEPVTLAQLVGLLGQEAQAELDRADSAQGSLPLNETEAELEAAAEGDASLAPEDEPAGSADQPLPEGDGTAGVQDVREPEVREPDVSEQDVSEQDEAGPGAAEHRNAAVDRGAEAPRADLAGNGVDVALPAEGDPAGVNSAGVIPEGVSAEGSDFAGLDPVPRDPAAEARAERSRMVRLRGHFRAVLDGLIAEYTTGDRGLEIREIAGGFRFATKPEYHDAVRGFVRSLKPPLKLTLQALETLAVVAYKQPVTSPEISEIRGVDSGGVLGSLIARKLITTAGRKQVIGRPILYKTTKEFLLKFGLRDLNELPGIEEFERMAGQMAEQEEIAMPDAADPRPDVDPALEQAAEKLEPQRETHSSQGDGEVAPADNLEGAPEHKASIDGRISSLPPNYDAADAADDPSAIEAGIQEQERN